MSQHEHALTYVRRGWKVIPLKPKEKTPLLSEWHRKATTEERIVRRWWKQWPDANLGIVTGKDSGIFVIDIDSADGEQSWTGVITEVPEIPEETLEQKTGRGRQLFFLYPKKRDVRNKQNLRAGLDIRGEGGYVVAPPSIHPNGQTYTWPYGLDVPIEKAPEKLLDIIAPKQKVIRPWEIPIAPTVLAPIPPPRLPGAPRRTTVYERASRYLQECEPAVQGSGGHNALLWAARSLVVGFEMSDGDAIDLLWSEYNPRCAPPWDRTVAADAHDFERKVLEAQRTPGEKPAGWLLDEYGLRACDDKMRLMGAKAAAALIANDNAKRVNVIPKGDVEQGEDFGKESKGFPVKCLPVGIRKYVEKVAEAQVVSPSGVALAVLVAAGSAMGNAFQLRLKHGFEVPPTLWGMIIARSGSNKSGPFREVIRPLRLPVPLEKIESAMLNPQGKLLIEDATTESVIDVMSRSPRGLCMANGEGAGWVGSFDRYSQGSKKKTSVDESIWLKFWDTDTYQKNRKTESEDVLIHSAACSVLACIQPEKMEECFDPTQFASGLVPRLLVVFLPKVYREWSDREVSKKDSQFWADVIMHLRTRPFANLDPNTGQFGPNMIELGLTAKFRYVDEFNNLAKRVHATDDISALFASKMQGMIGRITLVLHGLSAACGDCEILEKVSEQTMLNAIEISKWALAEQLRVYGLAGERFIAQRCSEIKMLAANRDGVIVPRDLQRSNKNRWPTAAAAKRDLDTLVEEGTATWDDLKKRYFIK